MASLRHRREMADGTSSADSAMEEEDHRRHLGLESMTAKGIQHLCSELLEIKKASEHDVYQSYLSFIRMFQEAGALEKDLHQHVLAHRRLVQHLSNNYSYPSSTMLVLEGAAITIACDHQEEKEEEEELDLELELDVLLSEHRMEEALELLELQGQALHDGIITNADEAMSAMKAKVADRFAFVADNPRTPRPELLKALSGLCKLGEAQRANHLLFKFYRPAAALLWKKSSSSNYIKELARMVFSSILEASRSFVWLHGHPSPHTPHLIRWAREEMEDFSVAFSEYVISISSQVGQSVVLALEAAKCAISYCSLLRIIVSEQDLLDLIAPCLQEVLTMYARHLKEVTRLLVPSDTWVLGRFPVSGMLGRARSPAAMAGGLQIEDCLLTTNGRKFLTLIQDVVENVYPLLDLGINNSVVLQLVAELFREYMHSVVELIPRKEADLHHQYMWQLSISINCTTLASLFPVIVHRIKSDQPSSVFLTQQGEVDSLILLIKETAGQAWTSFCQRFIRDTMSCLEKSGEGLIASSPQGMMPSFPSQVLFGRVRQLNNLYGIILTGKDGAIRNLLQELIEAVIFWLSSKLGSWIHNAQRDTVFQQIQLDVHFLLEFAQMGGFCTENIRTSALDLLTKAQEKVVSDKNNSDGWVWATDAAKHAVGVLMAISPSSPHQEASFDQDNNAQEEGGGANKGEDSVKSCQLLEDESGACDGGKSSDEFISIQEEDDESNSSSDSEIDDHDEANSGSEESHAVEVEEDDAINSPETPPSQQETVSGGSRGSSRRKREALTLSSRPRWR